MLKMVWFFHLFFLCLLGLTGAGQESIELLNLYEVVQASSHSALPVAVSVSVRDLDETSSSVLMAESWLRTHVLAHYPANKVTTVVVRSDLLCLKRQEHSLGLILLSLKNIYHSITRWGLEREIKVSPAFSSHCFLSDSNREDLAEKVIKPLSQFLYTVNSTYSLMSSSSSDKTLTLVSSYLESIKKLGFLPVNRVNVLIHTPQKLKPLTRKLSEADSKTINPYPARPTPLPEISPIHSSIGYSIPATVASPQSPLSHTSSSPPPTFYFPSAAPPPFSFPSAAPPPFSFPSNSPPPSSFPSNSPPPFSFPSNSPPPLSFPSNSPPPMTYSMAPNTFPASPPFGSLPPCSPIDNTLAPSPLTKGEVQSLWCVAKPSVPAETLQEAMDYACGEGGANCDEIQPHGSCFHPDSLVAHASYAFNSYWQKTKRNGGTCGFGGTAMLINADPSYVHCRFVLS